MRLRGHEEESFKIPENLTKPYELPFMDESKLRQVGWEAAHPEDHTVGSAMVANEINRLHVRVSQANKQAYAACFPFLSLIVSQAQGLIASSTDIGRAKQIIEMGSGQIDSQLPTEQEQLRESVQKLWSERKVMTLFSRKHRLNYSCRFPKKVYVLLLKALMVCGESALNSSLTAAMSNNGGSEGTIYAAMISIANIGLGTCAGLLLRGIRHIEKQVRIRAWVTASTVFAFQLGFAYAMAIMVSQAEAGNAFDPSQPIATFFKPGMSFWPWHFSLDGLRLWGLTLAFGVISIVLAFRGFLCEKYPGYVSVAAPYNKRYEAILKTLKDLEKRLVTGASAVLPDEAIITEELSKEVRLLTQSILSLKHIIQVYSDTEEHNKAVYTESCKTITTHYEHLMGKNKKNFTFELLPSQVPELQQHLAQFESALERKRGQLKEFQEHKSDVQLSTYKRHHSVKTAFLQEITGQLSQIRKDICPWDANDSLGQDSKTEPKETGSKQKHSEQTSFWGGSS